MDLFRDVEQIETVEELEQLDVELVEAIKKEITKSTDEEITEINYNSQVKTLERVKNQLQEKLSNAKAKLAATPKYQEEKHLAERNAILDNANILNKKRNEKAGKIV